MDKLHVLLLLLLLLLLLKMLSATIYLCVRLVALWDEEFPGCEKTTIILL